MTLHHHASNEAQCAGIIAIKLESVQKLATQLVALLCSALGSSKESLLCQGSLLQENYLWACADLSSVLEIDAGDALTDALYGPGRQFSDGVDARNGLPSFSRDIEELHRHSEMLHSLLQHAHGASGESFRRLGEAFQEPYIRACADLAERMAANVTTILAGLGRVSSPRDSQVSKGRLSAANSTVGVEP